MYGKLVTGFWRQLKDLWKYGGGNGRGLDWKWDVKIQDATTFNFSVLRFESYGKSGKLEQYLREQEDK